MGKRMKQILYEDTLAFSFLFLSALSFSFSPFFEFFLLPVHKNENNSLFLGGNEKQIDQHHSVYICICMFLIMNKKGWI